jgi:hypothetical protein
MARPNGKPPQVNENITVTLTDKDRRYVDLMCRILGVGYSEFFRIALASVRDLSREPFEEAEPMEAIK